MAYVAWLIRSEPLISHDHRSTKRIQQSPPNQRPSTVFIDPSYQNQNFIVREQAALEIIFAAADQNIFLHDFEAELIDPEGVSHVIQPRRTAKGALVAFSPDQPGQYQVIFFIKSNCLLSQIFYQVKFFNLFKSNIHIKSKISIHSNKINKKINNYFTYKIKSKQVKKKSITLSLTFFQVLQEYDTFLIYFHLAPQIT